MPALARRFYPRAYLAALALAGLTIRTMLAAGY